RIAERGQRHGVAIRQAQRRAQQGGQPSAQGRDPAFPVVRLAAPRDGFQQQRRGRGGTGEAFFGAVLQELVQEGAGCSAAGEGVNALRGGGGLGGVVRLRGFGQRGLGGGFRRGVRRGLVVLGQRAVAGDPPRRVRGQRAPARVARLDRVVLGPVALRVG